MLRNLGQTQRNIAKKPFWSFPSQNNVIINPCITIIFIVVKHSGLSTCGHTAAGAPTQESKAPVAAHVLTK